MCSGEKPQRPRGSPRLEGVQDLQCGCCQEFKRMEVQECKGSRGWRGQKMQTLHGHRYLFRFCWHCSRSYASIQTGQGEAGTLADCIYEHMLTTLRKDWQETKLLVMNRNKDTSLKVSAGILKWMADQYMLQSRFNKTLSRQNIEREARTLNSWLAQIDGWMLFS